MEHDIIGLLSKKMSHLDKYVIAFINTLGHVFIGHETYVESLFMLFIIATHDFPVNESY